MECEKPEPTVTLTTSPCDEGVARYVSVGESNPFTTNERVSDPYQLIRLAVQNTYSNSSVRFKKTQ